MTNQARKWLKFRIITVLIFFSILFVALVSRAFQLQILSRDALKAKAERQHTRTLKIQTERGHIFDRNGKVLAASFMVDSVYADPSQIRDHKGVSVKLASVLGLKKRNIMKKLSTGKRFCWIGRKISPKQSQAITKLNMDGIYLIKEPKRYYTNKGSAGHLLGFVGMDSEGLAGLELKYNEYLKGTSKRVSWGKDARGHRFYMEDGADGKEVGGSRNLILTIDSRIQHIVEVQLQKAVEETGSKGGVTIVMDPRTGEILAMACEPGFNPTVFSHYSSDTRRNRAIADCFDPGSIFKPFVVAAALEEGVVEYDELFDCENGAYVVGRKIIHEAEGEKYGLLNVREILKHSSNIGSIKVAQKLGKEKLYQYMRKFGFATRTAIDLPGEATGIVRNPQQWTDVDFATIAFGQGLSVTAIQMITAMSAIANQGVVIKPSIVRGLVDKNGKVIEEFTPIVVGKAISPLTAHRITSFLMGVVNDDDGTGQKARIENVSVAGKTGTSQKFDFDAGYYSSDKVRASFLGFFPAEDPQMTILVILDEPQTKQWGGQAAAPVFKNISEQILRRFNRNVGERELFAEEDTREFKKISSAEILNDRESTDETVMPDFRGMSMREIIAIARERDLNLEIIGSGWAVSQKPVPGSPIMNKLYCKIMMSPGY
jgi:cell division protein FtsI (penicillin-binding protein 3)